MAQFLRRIAPAVLVGTAAVAVAGSALGGGNEATVNAAATGAVPNGSNNGSVPQSGGSLEDWLNELEDDEDEDDDGDDNDDSEEGGSNGYVAPAPAPATSAPSSGSGSSGTTTSTSCDSQEIVGPVVRTEWGPVQVAAKVSGGRVCAVRTIQTPDGDRKSIMINTRAVPVLEQQVLAAGNAQIDGVSGATVTTVGYTTSLQAILDGV
ncbi:MAG: hypothetical protein QG597_2652 [Actinomycetota bacterium]|nr:hypothetical protein [Actinomycetota bacterium]